MPHIEIGWASFIGRAGDPEWEDTCADPVVDVRRVKCFGPRIRSKGLQAMRKPPAELKLQTVVIGSSGIARNSNRGELCVGRGKLLCSKQSPPDITDIGNRKCLGRA